MEDPSEIRSEFSYWALPAYELELHGTRTIWEKSDISSLEETNSWETRMKHKINITEITIHPLRRAIAVFLAKEVRRTKRGISI